MEVDENDWMKGVEVEKIFGEESIITDIVFGRQDKVISSLISNADPHAWDFELLQKKKEEEEQGVIFYSGDMIDNQDRAAKEIEFQNNEIPGREKGFGLGLIHYASYYGRVRIVEFLLKLGVSPNLVTRNQSGNTPLILASMRSLYFTLFIIFY
mgnify:CR=1 FL=1